MDYTDAFNAVTAIGDEKRKTQDLEDLDHERAGVDVGRISRFLGSENNPRNIQAKREREDRQFRTMLELMLLDEEYRTLYNNAMDRLSALENATQRAIEKVEQDLAHAQENLQSVLDRAVTLDGVRVFKDENGQVWTEHGTRVKDTDAEQIEWTGAEPDHEEYVSGQSAVSQQQDAHKELLKYQTDVLGSARERITDENNPLTKDELSSFIQDIEDAAPAAVQSENKATANVAAEAITREPQLDIEIPTGQGFTSGM